MKIYNGENNTIVFETNKGTVKTTYNYSTLTKKDISRIASEFIKLDKVEEQED